MRRVLDMLSGGPADEGRFTDVWFSRLERSLVIRPDSWLEAVESAGELTKDQAWTLLGWIERAATHVARTGRPETLKAAAFAMALVARSDLDPRDCMIVASLLRRASVLADVDFASCVQKGCDMAKALGPDTRDLLLHASAHLPATHVEAGTGATLEFQRVPPEFDVVALEGRLRGDDS